MPRFFLSDGRTTAVSSVDSFAVKSGSCRFEDGALLFDTSRLGYIRNLYEGYWREGGWYRLLFLGYVLAPVFGLVSLALGYDETGPVAWYVLAAVVVALLGVWAYQRFGRGFTSVDRIPLDAIESVEAVEGTRGLTRPRLVVTYCEGDERRRRYVLLPSTYLPDGEDAFERACAAFRERGFAVGA